MEPTGHLGSPIFKGENHQCEWCRSVKKSDSFPICRNPATMYFMKQSGSTFVIKCPDDLNECQFYVTEKENHTHRKLIGKYLDKYSEDGYVLIPEVHLPKLSEKMGVEHSAIYINMLFRSWGWYQIKKGEEMDDGLLYTNKQSKEVMSTATIGERIEQ